MDSNEIKIVSTAIQESISHGEIVIIERNSSVTEYLRCVSSGHVKNDSVDEYWGADDTGHAWRVHTSLGKRFS